MDSLLKTFENWVTTKIDERLALTGYTKSDELIAKDKELGTLQRDCLDLLENRIDAIDLLDAKTNAVLNGVGVKFEQLNTVQNTMNDITKAIDAINDRFEVHAKHFNDNTKAVEHIENLVGLHAKHFNDNTNDADKRVDDHAKHLTDNTNAVESLENRFEDLEQQCSEAVTRFEIFDINDHVDFTEAVTYEIEQLDLTDYIDRGRIVDEIEDSFRISISADIIRKS